MAPENFCWREEVTQRGRTGRKRFETRGRKVTGRFCHHYTPVEYCYLVHFTAIPSAAIVVLE
jgi:hypothetical protein